MGTTSSKYRKLTGLLSLLVALCLLVGQLPLIALAAEEITLTYVSGAAEDGAGRYRLIFTGITDSTDRYWNGNTVYIDGVSKSGDGVNYVPSAVYGGTEGELWLCLDYDMVEPGVSSAASMGTHTLRIKAGTQMAGGAFSIAKDVWLKLSGTSVSLLTPITLTLSSGGGAQDFATRYLMSFDGITDNSDRYWNGNTVYIDGVAQSGEGVNYTTGVENGKLTLCLDYSKVQAGAVTAESITAHTMEIKAGTVIGGDFVVAETVTVSINGYEFSQVVSAEEPDLTVTLSNDPLRNDTSATTGFYFYVDPADSLASDVNTWQVRYAMTTGGISVNGTVVEGAKLVKLLSNLYYVAFDGTGYGPFVTGDVVTVDGTVTDGGYTVRYSPQSFEYNASTGWNVYTPKTDVSITGLGVHHGAQDFASRYLASFVLTSPYTGTMNATGLPVTVNGTPCTAEVFKEGDELAVILPYSQLPQGGEYTVIVPAGTEIEGRKLAEDFIFYVHADGAVNTEPPSTPVTPDTFVFNNGAWQPDNARYGLAFAIEGKTSLTLETKVYAGVVSIDGKPAEAALCFTDGSFLYIFLDASNGITAQGNHTVVLQKGAVIGDYTVADDITLYTVVDAPVSTTKPTTPPPASPDEIPPASELVDVFSDNRNLSGNCTGGFYFMVSPSDALPFDLDNWSVRYPASVGGIYVNGELTAVKIIKLTESLYYIPLSDFGITPVKGDVVTIDGEFGNTQHAVKYTKQNFVYYGDGVWEIGTYVRDLREDKYIVQDISELMDGLSSVTIIPAMDQKIGELKQSTNVALSFEHSWDKKADQLTVGLSKVAGMWDVEASGWQFWFRPRFGQVFLAHGVSEWQVTAPYEFAAETSTVLIGSVNVYEYVDGVKGELYGRKIFLAIDGEEVLSYVDTDTTRTLGKGLYVYTDGDTTEFRSLVSKETFLKEKEPTVYDLFDVSGNASESMVGLTSALFATLPTSTNIGVKMRVEVDPSIWEFKLSLSKIDPTNYWDIDASGWQFWFRPENQQVFIGFGDSEYEALVHHQFKAAFDLEIGQRDVVLVKNGKEAGLYARRLYVKIDGKEIITWDDKDFDRPLGTYGLYYIPESNAGTLSTFYPTADLSVEVTENGQTVEKSRFVTSSATVVVGEECTVSVTVKEDYDHKAIYNGLYYNDQLLQAVANVEGKYTYVLPSPAASDKLRVDLSVKDVTCDEIERVYDIFDVSGKTEITVPLSTENRIGAMVDMENGQAGINSAVRFGIRLPKEGYNQIHVGMLIDNRGLWGNSGMLIRLLQGRVDFLFSATSHYLVGFPCDLLKAGGDVIVEMGAVKCYVNGLYKYDRFYVKVGETVDDLKLVGWFDSTERGHYGNNFGSYGADVGGAYTMYSLKEVYSLTDVSSDTSKALINSYDRMGQAIREIYFPDKLVAYATTDAADKIGRISFFTKPGSRLEKFTVNGADVTDKVTIGADGAYVYTLESLTGDVDFAYSIIEDASFFKIDTSALDSKLHLTASLTDIPAGGDVTLSVKADKGYIPTLTVNGADMTDKLTLDADKGVWTLKLRAVRADLLIGGTAAEKAYVLSLTQSANGKITVEGDLVDGKLSAGGKLIVRVTANDGYLLEGVLVNGKRYPLIDGRLELPAVYVEGDTIAVEAVLTKGAVAAVAASLGWLWWVIGGTLVVAVAAVVLLLVFGKKKKGESKTDA
ncbi:MAG: hypothetical protein IK954_01900 [Clostridia bacterium]|nr:hypothetical protein [Clostridia bacterium]